MRIADLQVAKETSAQAGLGWRAQVVAFLLAALIVFSRRPDAFLNPQFFGEDGAVWYADAYTRGWAGVLFVPYAGYIELLPKLAAGFALLVPLVFAPAVMNAVGVTVQILPVTFLLSARCANFGSLYMRVAMSLLYLTLPNTHELNVTVTNAQWHLALVACLVVLSQVPGTVWGKIFDAAVLFVSGFTGPFCVLLLPVSVIFWWFRRARWRLVHVSILGLCFVVQVSLLFGPAGAARAHLPLGATPKLLSHILASHIYLAALFGTDNYPALQGDSLMWVATIIGTMIVVYGIIAAKLEMRLLLLFCVGIFLAALRTPVMSQALPQWQALDISYGIRYWFFPMLAFVWSLVVIFVNAKADVLRVGSAALLITMLAGIIHDWFYQSFPDRHFSDKVRAFNALPVGDSADIPIVPDGWTVHLVKLDRTCSDLPLGHIDDPSRPAKASGYVGLRGWTAGLKPIKEAQIFLDDKPAVQLTINEKRPDVDRYYPAFPAGNKGWRAGIDLGQAAPGMHRLELRAVGGGCRAEIQLDSLPIERVTP